MQPISKATLVVQGHTNNSIFDLSPQKNADNWYYPYQYLKSLFEIEGIELNTPDVNRNNSIKFELHMDVQTTIKSNVPCYAMLYETQQIRPVNQKKSLLDKYARVFTWRDELVDNKKYIKIQLPNKILVSNSLGWQDRERFCCIIANNKTVPYASPLFLYPERVEAIRWFEQYAPENFDLYGSGWNSSVARHGLIGRIANKLQRLTPKRTGKVFFPSYRGRVDSKLDTLKRYRFSICYENVRDLPGYITEKIFDCFFAGCIPVYWGAANIDKYIPEDCFIDRRKFLSHESLYQFMVSMKESEYVGYQERIAAFLLSDRAKPFGAEAFAETIVNTIIADLAVADSFAQLG